MYNGSQGACTLLRTGNVAASLQAGRRDIVGKENSSNAGMKRKTTTRPKSLSEWDGMELSAQGGEVTFSRSLQRVCVWVGEGTPSSHRYSHYQLVRQRHRHLLNYRNQLCLGLSSYTAAWLQTIFHTLQKLYFQTRNRIT